MTEDCRREEMEHPGDRKKFRSHGERECKEILG